jgi:transcriptional regulator with GAF, ATPase, and Fis domain
MSRPESPDREILERLQALDGLLTVLTGALDIREIFTGVSDIARKVLPHDAMGLPVFTEDREHVLAFGTEGLLSGAERELLPVPESLRPLMAGPWDFDIVDDLLTDPMEGDTRRLIQSFVRLGFRSVLRAPVRLRGQLVAVLSFFSRAPSAYSPSDAVVACRIADHVALALSHQRLAEEAERTAEVRERASMLARRVDGLMAEVQSLGGHRRVVGESKAWKDVLRHATQVASTDTTVLLLGDSGTGKEVVARLIHRASARSGGAFVALNCAALPEQLLESELFGYERGAFTGAMTSKPGQIEQAAGGVLFLDEVGEMSLSAQAKFLRVLQEKEFQRLGGTRVLKASARVIAATNRDLSAAVERGTFREDLYYRLQVFEIILPRLRDHPEDILPLSEAFLEDIGRSFGRPPAGISREARQVLLDYHWPGNVRQLRNALERAAIVCEGGLITGEHLSLPARAPGSPPPVPADVASAHDGAGGRDAAVDLKSMERSAIEHALRQARHNKSQAARLLGLTRTQLYVRLRKHGLD